jgi:hypothetical protein
MFSRNLAKAATIAGLAIAMAACSHDKNKEVVNSEGKVDAAAVAETKLSDSGCQFESIFLPQDQVNIVNRLKCEGDKFFDQKEAIGQYINDLSEIMKDKERTDLGELQTKLDGAVEKFMEVDSAWRKAVSLPADNKRAELNPGSNDTQDQPKAEISSFPAEYHR